MITGIELISVIVGINLLSYIFQVVTVGFEEPYNAKEELLYFILFMFGGIYLLNVGSAEYTKMRRSSDSSELGDAMKNALEDLEDELNQEDDN